MVRHPDARGSRAFLALSFPPDMQQRASAVDASQHALPKASRASATPTLNRTVRLAAFGLLGATLGIGGAIGGISYVQASDSSDRYEVTRFDAGRKQARRAMAAQPAYHAIAPAISPAYAPARPALLQPLARTGDRRLVIFPDFNINPFRPTGNARPLPEPGTTAAAPAGLHSPVVFDGTSGAVNRSRSICVSLCDGYQFPLGYLHTAADLPAHDALCKATFPGVPTRIFRLAPGAVSVDEAVGPDGRSYRALPMAGAYQTAIDRACARPRTGAQTVSLLKDFTLRVGDTVIVNGRPKVFRGSDTYPYTAANFRDFRSSPEISHGTRAQVDAVVGVSRQERLSREVSRISRVREANATDSSRAVDVIRGGFSIDGAPASNRKGTGVRIIVVSRP